MILAKGHAYLIQGQWYVLVEIAYQRGKIYMHCICDHANNIYSYEPREIEEWFDTRRLGYDTPKSNRELPESVIAEVLIGQHDDRFNHWLDSEEGFEK